MNVWDNGGGAIKEGINSSNSGFNFNAGPIQSITFTASPTAAVPFNIPGGATIPTVGSLFALALMRKAKKSLASKTPIANPVETVVS
ncbi:hypothetical protein [Anabaena lutea]|uniref:Uncharacterized protein n=1 Tax=Anabaena lutea FACHB-196 TaxID=2692881 RepID=A0ABR8FIH5_9NOST|nr:hypothetical protein [Anabaena lutea]MBD2569571.1 hypothetical protein [Anabaena lutea FACHB-196]